MAASCAAISLSSSSFPSFSKAIPESKTLISSFYSSSSETLKAQFPCSISFNLSAPSRPLVAKKLQTNVSSSNFSVLNEEAIGGEDNVGDIVVSDEEQGKKKERPCELYVCNLPRSYDIPQLLEMFKLYGTVVSIEVSRNPETGESRGSGYVTMSSVYSAKVAIAALDGTVSSNGKTQPENPFLHQYEPNASFLVVQEVGGREMRVRFSVEMNPGTRRNPAVLNSTPKKILVYESQYKIYVGNLPWATKPGDLRNHFSRFGNVVSVRVLQDRKGSRIRIFAFLSYSKPEERDAAISLNGTVEFMFPGNLTTLALWPSSSFVP